MEEGSQVLSERKRKEGRMKWKVQEDNRKGEREGKDEGTKYKTVEEKERRRERRLGGKSAR